MVAEMYRQELSSKASNIDKFNNEVSSRLSAADSVKLLPVVGAAFLADGLSASPSPPTTFIEHDSRSSSSDDDDMHVSANEVNRTQRMISPPPPHLPNLSLVEGLTVSESEHAEQRSCPSCSPVSSSLSPSLSEVSVN